MGMVTKGMDKVLGTMNVEAISKVMEQFERSFEDMDVRSEYVEQTMNSSTTAAMPEEEVDSLMQMVADEHGLKMSDIFQSAGIFRRRRRAATARRRRPRRRRFARRRRRRRRRRVDRGRPRGGAAAQAAR